MPKIYGIKEITIGGKVERIPTINGKFAPVTEWEKMCVEAYELKNTVNKLKEDLINDIKSQREEN